MGRLGSTVVKTFISDGNAYNLDLGFVPDHIRIINSNAADTEVAVLEWFYGMGEAQEIWWYNSDTGEQNFVKKASAGYVTTFDTSTAVGARLNVTFDDTGGAAEDLVTCTAAAGHGLSNGEKVKFVESGGLPTNVSELSHYYVIDATATTFRISSTLGGSAFSLGSDGTAPNYVISLDNLGAADASNGLGITISATFMADGDYIWVYATKADVYEDLGDVA